MKTVKRLLSLSVVLTVTTAFLVLTSCSNNSPKKPEWVERGAERDTSGGMIRHIGTGTGKDKDVAVFAARQQALQATTYECGGQSLTKSVVRKSWVEPVMDIKDDEKIDYYQASVVVEVPEDLCEDAQAAKLDPNKIRENQRVSEGQDTYSELIRMRSGLPPNYFLQYRQLAETMKAKAEMANALMKERENREQAQEDMLELMYRKTHNNKERPMADKWKSRNNQDVNEGAINECRHQVGGLEGQTKYGLGRDSTHPASAPYWELLDKIRARCDEVEAGTKKVIDWDYDAEIRIAKDKSEDIEDQLGEEKHLINQELKRKVEAGEMSMDDIRKGATPKIPGEYSLANDPHAPKEIREAAAQAEEAARPVVEKTSADLELEERLTESMRAGEQAEVKKWNYFSPRSDRR